MQNAFSSHSLNHISWHVVLVHTEFNSISGTAFITKERRISKTLILDLQLRYLSVGFRLIWKKSQPRKHNRSQSSQLMTWSISRIRKLFLPFKINPSTSGGLGSGRKQKLFISQLHFALPLSPDSGMYVANARAISCAENSTRHLSPDVNTKMTDPQDFPHSVPLHPSFHTSHMHNNTPPLLSAF